MKRVDSKDLNIIGERYSSIAEFYRVNEQRPLNPNYSSDRKCGVGSRRNVTSNREYTWDETRHDMMYGSSLFDEEFHKVLAEVESQLPDSWKVGKRNRVRNDYVGQSVNVGRALSGHPRSFNRQRPVRLRQKMVTILFSISCPWFTSTHDRMRAGCIVMAVCEHMERQGYQTRILYAPDFSFGNRGRPADDPQVPSQVMQVALKDFPTRFNLRKMQFPLASESALFHVGCWWNHRFPGTTFDWGEGEGYAVDNDSKRLERAREFARRQGAVYLSIPFIVNDCGSDAMKVYDYVMGELS